MQGCVTIPALDELDEFYRDLGARVSRRRRSVGLTQQELAERAGLSQPHIQAIEAGRTKRPTIAALLKVARALSTDLAADVAASRSDGLPPSLLVDLSELGADDVAIVETLVRRLKR